MKYKKGVCPDKSRLGCVGGQAVLEGVMMKAGSRTVTSCRKEDGSIIVTDDTFESVRKKHKILDLPLIRGVINFVEMMKLSITTLEASTAALGLEEEEETKFEKWLKKHFGVNITSFIMVIGVILGLALSVGLFMVLPSLISAGIDWLLGGTLGLWAAVVEGVAKVVIFLTYLWLVSFMPEIKRTFMYHGAEHKTIAAFEAGVELTPENCKEYTRFHPRCGTSFMFVMILLGIFAGLFVRMVFPGLRTWAYILIRLAILPLVVGIGYEFIMFAGKHDNAVTRTLSAPGLWVQRITTKEPTLDMLEVAIVSTKCALRDRFPEFQEFFDMRAWEKHEESPEASEDGTACEVVENTSTEESSDELPCQSHDTDGASAEPITDATANALATEEATPISPETESEGVGLQPPEEAAADETAAEAIQ